MVLVLFGHQAERAVLSWMHVDAMRDPMLHPLEGVWHWISLLARYAVAFGAIVFITGLLYYFGPNRRQRWHRVWPGAILATILWLAATAGFGWYVRNVASSNRGGRGLRQRAGGLGRLCRTRAILGCNSTPNAERSPRASFY